MVIFETKSITKVYDPDSSVPTKAIRGIDLTINKGEFVVIMGASGSGKSTLLNVLTGIDMPTSGEVIIEGVTTNQLEEKELAKLRYQKYCYIFQDYNLVQELTIFDNIAFPLMMNKVKRKDAKPKIVAATRELGIFELLNKYPSDCSGGQQQRVALARALANNQEILIADEPTGNLDSKNSEEVMELIKKLNQQGVTVLLVTHDAKVAAKASRLLYITDGMISDELYKGDKEESHFYQEIAQLIAKSRIGGAKSGSN